MNWKNHTLKIHSFFFSFSLVCNKQVEKWNMIKAKWKFHLGMPPTLAYKWNNKSIHFIDLLMCLFLLDTTYNIQQTTNLCFIYFLSYQTRDNSIYETKVNVFIDFHFNLIVNYLVVVDSKKNMFYYF